MKDRAILSLITVVVLAFVLVGKVIGFADSKENKAIITILSGETEQTTISTDKNNPSGPMESSDIFNGKLEENKKKVAMFPTTNTSESSKIFLLVGAITLINLCVLYYYNKRNEEKKNESN